MKKIIALILALLTLLSLVACTGTTGGGNQQSESENVGDNDIFEGLPEVNYGGKDFVIHGRTYTEYEFKEQEDLANNVNKALYERNQRVNRQFGINITTVIEPYTWDSRSDYVTRLRNNQTANVSEFDLVAGYIAVVSQLVGEGTFLNWNDQLYIDTSKEWWAAQFNEEMTVNGRSYMITGDAALSLWKNMSCVYFNKKIASDFNLEYDMYQLVENKEWDLEKLIEISKLVYSDSQLTGTQGVKDAGDTFGLLLGRSTAIDNMMMAFNLPITKKDGNGVPQMSLRTPKFVNAASDVVSFANDPVNNVFFIAQEYQGGDSESIKQRFMNSEGLFFMGLLGDSEQIRPSNIGDNVGILPYPKYNENQEDYMSTSRDEFSCFFLPSNAADPEMSALVLEALAITSQKYVVPEYYNVALQSKLTTDVESSAMIDLIREKLTFNFGFIYGTSIEHIQGFLAGCVQNNNAAVDSKYQQNEKAYKDALTKVLEPYVS